MPDPRRLPAPLTLLGGILVVAAIVAGCTATRKPKPVPGNRVLQEHMQNIHRGGIALGRAVDEGDAREAANMARYIGTQFMATRGIRPAKELDPAAEKAYDREQEDSIRDLNVIIQGVEANHWAAVANGYNSLRTRCAVCHRSFVDREIIVSLPVPENF
jgi:hypothetical protein